MEAKKKKKTVKRRRKVAAGSRGLPVAEIRAPNPPAAVRELGEQVERDGGSVLCGYRDPLGGHWQLMIALPLAQVKPTAFQRNLSDTHVKRLADKIDRLDRFLDPIILVRVGEGAYETPNGYHRIAALGRLGAKTVTGLLVPEPRIAYQILALNCEKAANVREKSMEAMRLERELARLAPGETEGTYAAEFEEPAFLTLGACYERKAMFSGGAYYPVLRRTDEFVDEKLGKAIGLREKRADKLFKLDEAVVKAVDALKERGLKSPYLKTFVIARINPLRFKRDAVADFDETYDKMMESARKFDPSKIQQHHLAGMGGAPAEEG